ncbi:predicted protein [Uncinocarpus reesii 1704]|uniref:Uncharacterized protein n=1 Tax=Uncinocarpus reesii (strain UAMH 1704) TaxID=336963 RepID=C4JFW5_UNCRE|nr:uncharacterized protein UREG_01045 [Uncinocarpus reesii 1704]EEP76196.1 predicted protein [Uncinocarpus reesii 1704]
MKSTTVILLLLTSLTTVLALPDPNPQPVPDLAGTVFEETAQACVRENGRCGRRRGKCCAGLRCRWKPVGGPNRICLKR